MTLTALETGLHKIESSRERKNTLNILYDQCKSGTVPAARVLHIITNNIEHETAVDVLQDTLRFIVPCILNNYLHEEVWESKKSQMFDLVMRILHSGRFEEYPSAIETLVTSAVSFAVTQSEVVLVSKWFQAGKIFDSEGATIRGASINV